MAEKITLFEIHAHTDGSSLNLEPSVGSGVGRLVRNALSSGEEEGESGSVVESLEADEEEADGEDDGDLDEIEFESDEDEADNEEDNGAGKGTGLAGLLALIAFVFLARNFLGEDDEEDPFEEEFGQ